MSNYKWDFFTKQNKLLSKSIKREQENTLELNFENNFFEEIVIPVITDGIKSDNLKSDLKVEENQGDKYLMFSTYDMEEEFFDTTKYMLLLRKALTFTMYQLKRFI